MKRFIACLLGAALVIAGPALAENDEPYDPSEANWEFKWLNDAGREVGKRRATEAFATVEGRRNLRLSIGCNLEEKRRVIRIEREVENEERAQFTERVLDFEVVVWYRGDIIFTTERGVLRWQEDEGYYEGRAGPRATEAIQRGNRVVFQDEEQDFRAAFPLRGSYNAIAQLPCD